MWVSEDPGVLQIPPGSRHVFRALQLLSCSGISATLDIEMPNLCSRPSLTEGALSWRNPLHCRQNPKAIQCQTLIHPLFPAWFGVYGLQLPGSTFTDPYLGILLLKSFQNDVNIDLILLLSSLLFESTLVADSERDLSKSRWDEGLGTSTRQPYKYLCSPWINGEWPILLASKLLFRHLPFLVYFPFILPFCHFFHW